METQFRLLLQPTNNTCGQTVIAMIVGVETKEICEKMRIRQTRPIELRGILRQYGWKMERLRCCSYPEAPEHPAVFNGMTVQNNHLIKHFMLWTGHEFYDPAYGDRMEKNQLGDIWAGGFYKIEKIK